MTQLRKNVTGGRAVRSASRATVAAGLALGLVDFAVARGAVRDEVLSLAGLDQRALTDHDRRLSVEDYRSLIRVATALTNDPALSLNFGLQVDLADLSAVGLLLQASATIAEVLIQLNRYTPLLVETECTADERFLLESGEDGMWIVDTRRDPNSFPELTEMTFARFVRSTRQFGMRSFVTEVHVTHSEPDHVADYARVFGIPTRFSRSWNAMRVNREWLSQPVQLQPSYLTGIVAAHTEALLKELGKAQSVREQVEWLLMPILHTDEVGMERAAGALGLSSDTLYRRLRAEGATFEEVLDNLRRRVALRYVEEEDVPINQIAYLVGFSEPSAFSRAFKRWTGRSPRGFRPSPSSVSKQPFPGSHRSADEN